MRIIRLVKYILTWGDPDLNSYGPLAMFITWACIGMAALWAVGGLGLLNQ